MIGNDMGREVYQSAWVIGAVFAGTGQWNSQILAGQDPNWGRKVVSVLRSSDHRGHPDRSQDRTLSPFTNWGHEPLVTYLKLSEPTVESLKQALVSGESKRVFYIPPRVPSTFLHRLTIERSPLLCCPNQLEGKLEATFSPHLNCIIGGRGTGKTILLSALARVLGVDSGWVRESPAEWQKRHLSLFQPGAPFDPEQAKISLEYERNGIQYRVDYARNDGVNLWTLYRQDGCDWLLLSSFDERPPDVPDSLFYLQGQLGALTDYIQTKPG